MKGENYYGMAIEGTKKQFHDILARFNYHPDNGSNPIHTGIWRIRNGVLCIETEGWGTEIAYAKETQEHAESIGCKVYWLHLPMFPEDIPGEIMNTNDDKEKYFIRETCGNGIIFYRFKKEYERTGKEND